VGWFFLLGWRSFLYFDQPLVPSGSAYTDRVGTSHEGSCTSCPSSLTPSGVAPSLLGRTVCHLRLSGRGQATIWLIHFFGPPITVLIPPSFLCPRSRAPGGQPSRSPLFQRATQLCTTPQGIEDFDPLPFFFFPFSFFPFPSGPHLFVF